MDVFLFLFLFFYLFIIFFDVYLFMVGYRYDIQQITDLYPAHLYCSYIHFAQYPISQLSTGLPGRPPSTSAAAEIASGLLSSTLALKLREAFTRSFLFFSVKKLSSFSCL